jgi:hypothetical protein
MGHVFNISKWMTYNIEQYFFEKYRCSFLFLLLIRNFSTCVDTFSYMRACKLKYETKIKIESFHYLHEYKVDTRKKKSRIFSNVEFVPYLLIYMYILLLHTKHSIVHFNF